MNGLAISTRCSYEWIYSYIYKYEMVIIAWTAANYSGQFIHLSNWEDYSMIIYQLNERTSDSTEDSGTVRQDEVKTKLHKKIEWNKESNQ